MYSSNMLTRMRAEWVRELINRGFLPSSFRDTQPSGCWLDADVLSIRGRVRSPPDVKGRNRMAWSSEGPRHSCYTGLSFIVCCLMKIVWLHVAARDTGTPPPHPTPQSHIFLNAVAQKENRSVISTTNPLAFRQTSSRSC